MAACVTKSTGTERGSIAAENISLSNGNLLSFVRLHIEKAALRMVVTLVQLVARESTIARRALELDDTGEQLPKEVPPGDLLGPQAEDKFVQLEVFVRNVRRGQLSMSIDENLTLLTDFPATLAMSEELATVGAPHQHIRVFLEQNF